MGTAVGLPIGESILTTDERASARAEESALVRAARDGDQRAFERLYVSYGRMVHGILLARVPRVQVDDLVQDVFIAAWQRLRSLRDDAAFGGWLAAIARNRATDHHRQVVDTVALSEDLSGHGGMPDAPYEAARALEAIRALPDAYRETLVLRLVEGLSGPEIADRTGLTPASVRVNLHRGMKLLREKLGIQA
ncbi:MAG TPA: sigma-70 family RNA polymerase sigma factor [Vicinamibacterales bacterium]|nr:sigma-70 family RNA polymerase sigma factor [Vicinamibacterales bacterium]